MVVAHTFNPSTRGGGGQVDLCEIEASLVYRASSRTASKATEKPCHYQNVKIIRFLYIILSKVCNEIIKWLENNMNQVREINEYLYEDKPKLEVVFADPFNQKQLIHQACVGAARSGNLTFMVGGVEDEFAAAQELLGCMGSNVIYCGAVGTGQAAKICNNMLLAISMIGTAEAMNLGIRSGLDPKLLAKILNMSSGRCWSSDTYNPVPGVMDGVPSSNNYQGGFGTTLMAKDLGLAQDSATSTKSPILLGSLAHQIYRMMCAKGYSKKDFSSVFQYLREEETF
ncbi:Hibadh [Phodopus roborovskii]|uniref:3-hydroxyisobutyrate dehydrogenase, mitochondrial n=1 Tax=Phodopus roborovskii TaxID=109678 RepID=A0AAV0A4M2_PHORO|nr:Hibadh [Phodopus roborovskii]